MQLKRAQNSAYNIVKEEYVHVTILKAKTVFVDCLLPS
jgi:hypothetical protein